MFVQYVVYVLRPSAKVRSKNEQTVEYIRIGP